MIRPTLQLPRFGFADGTLESWLASKDIAKHSLADEVFQQMGEEKTLTFLLTTVKVEERRRKQRGWRNLAIIWGGFFAVQIGLDSIMSHSHHFSIMGGVGSASMMAGNGGMPSRLHRRCLERLAMIDDRRILPTFVAALDCSQHNA